MTKLTRISLALLAIGLVMWVGYVAQGAFVDENGILKEAFPLLALGWLFILAGGVTLTGARLIKRFKGHK